MKEDFYRYFKLCFLEDKLPHAFLIETENIESEFLKIIQLLYDSKLIKNIDYINNLNLIIIEPEGKEIKSESITNLQKRFNLKPLNDRYNLYIIKNAEKMNNSSANKLLKFLEEPNSTTLGILISANSQVLPTIKSRCQIFKILDNQDNSTFCEEIKLLMDFLNNINEENELKCKNIFSKVERQELIHIIDSVIKKYNQDMNFKERTIPEIKKTAKIVLVLENILRLLKSNVNIELLLDKLCIEVKN